MKLKLLIAILAVSILGFMGLATVLAQTPSAYDVTVSPIYFDLSANPGDTLTGKIKLRNNTTAPIPLKLGVEKLTGDLNGNVTLKQDKNDSSLSWITFNSDTVTINPLEWTEVPFSIAVPKDAAYGYYWTITFAQDKTNPLAKNGVNLTGAAGVSVLLNVKKEGAVTSGKLISFTTDNGFYEYPPVKFTTKFENTGNVHIKPHGNIFIKDWLGRDLATLSVNETQGNILPNSARVFDASWDDGFITIEQKTINGQPSFDKNGKPQTELKFNWGKLLDLRFGRYTATELLVVSGATKDVSYQAEYSFWIFPWKFLGILILFIAFAAVGFYSTLKNLSKKVFALLGIKSQNKEG
jgi:hypothetical protein